MLLLYLLTHLDKGSPPESFFQHLSLMPVTDHPSLDYKHTFIRTSTTLIYRSLAPYSTFAPYLTSRPLEKRSFSHSSLNPYYLMQCLAQSRNTSVQSMVQAHYKCSINIIDIRSTNKYLSWSSSYHYRESHTKVYLESIRFKYKTCIQRAGIINIENVVFKCHLH